jgi:hypothetical protein
MKYRKIILLLLVCIFLSTSVSANFSFFDTPYPDWVNRLIELLLQFPSIFDRLYAEYNYEHGIIPVDAIKVYGDNGRIYYYQPFQVIFYDFDIDLFYNYKREFYDSGIFYIYESDGGIPKIAVLFAVPDTDLSFYIHYKYNGTRYIQSHFAGELTELSEFNRYIGHIMNRVYHLYEQGDASPETGTNIMLKIIALVFSAALYLLCKKYILT